MPDAGGVERTTRTDYLGYTNVITNALEQSRTDRRNVLGQIETVTDAAAGVTAFEYEPFGNLATTTDPRGNVIGVEYDRLGRKTKLNDPDLGIIIYKPDPAGRVQTQSSQVQRDRGERTDMVYDLLDRMTSRVERDLRSNWVYDSAVMGKGQLAESYIGNTVNDGYRRVHSYDALGRPGQTTQKLTDGVYSSTPTYDDWGRVIAQTYQRGGDAPKRFDSRYNDKGYLARVERGALVLWEVKEQDAASRVKGAALGNGLTQTRGFNPYTGRLDSGAVATAAGAQRVVEGYEYDVLGSVTKRLQYWDTLGFQERFEYDELNRLKLSEVQGKSPQSFTYHADGSMRSKTGVGTGDYVYLAQGAGVRLAHAVQSIPGIGAFSYDNNGNLLNGAGRTAEWTSFDMPKQITKGGVSSAFSYGTEYQRTLQSRGDGGSTIYAGAQEVETSGGQVTVKTYWPMGIGVEIDRPGKATELSWTHVDRLGSPIALTDEKGVIREKLAYDAWGKRRDTATMLAPDTVDGKTDNRGYTNHEMLDQLELVHMNGRVYDPFTAKFMSGDPLIQDPMNGQNYNRYSYVLNNPTNLTDPTGFACSEGDGTGSRFCAAMLDKAEKILGQAKAEFNNLSEEGKAYITKKFGPDLTSKPDAKMPSGSGGNNDSKSANSGTAACGQCNRYHGGGLGQEGQSTLLDLLPGVGSVKSAGQLVTGKDLVTGEEANRAVEGGGILLGMLPGGKLLTKLGKVGDAAVEGEKLLFRRGANDSKKLLETQAQAAENVLSKHGVSVSTSAAAKEGQVVRSATQSSVEAAGFKVTQTGKDMNHHTVEIPKPVTSEIARIWNELFK